MREEQRQPSKRDIFDAPTSAFAPDFASNFTSYFAPDYASDFAFISVKIVYVASGHALAFASAVASAFASAEITNS